MNLAEQIAAERGVSPIKAAMEELAFAMRTEDYLRTWQANIAMAYIDCGGDPVVANRAANTFLSRTFKAGKSEAPPINGDELAERFGAEEPSGDCEEFSDAT